MDLYDATTPPDVDISQQIANLQQQADAIDANLQSASGSWGQQRDRSRRIREKIAELQLKQRRDAGELISASIPVDTALIPKIHAMAAEMWGDGDVLRVPWSFNRIYTGKGGRAFEVVDQDPESRSSKEKSTVSEIVNAVRDQYEIK